MAMKMILLPSALQAQRTPESWNSDWEKLYRREFAFPHGPAACFMSYIAEVNATVGLAEVTFDLYDSHRRNLCVLQASITEDCLYFFSDNDFEAKWMDASPAIRGKHILIGLAKACSIASNLNRARSYCAHELRVPYLQGTGSVFLDLLKSVLLPDASFIPSTPIYVSHPEWDEFEARRNQSDPTEVEKIVLATILVLRTKLICHFLQFTMRSFLGEEIPDIPVLKATKRTERSAFAPMTRAVLEQALGADGAKVRRQEEKEGIKQRRAQTQRRCAYPGCTNVESADGSVKFSQCKRCMENVGREVTYCSQTCQRADWKPRHKAICGKIPDFETVTKVVPHPTELVNAAERIGPPVNGYKRPLLLISQVTSLNEQPDFDYILFNPQKASVPLKMGGPIQPIFRARREHAFTTGAIDSVAALAHFLCWCVAGQKLDLMHGLSSAGVVAQLAREFGLQFEHLRELVRQVQHVQDSHPHRIPPLLMSISESDWAKLFSEIDPADISVTFE
ncbi:hypothetical protein FB451DRAFT_1556292 [Mycena latifolia]|nr:hypothetical protein FB451DRAFT_1556292 [Mycena latifolia]